MRAVVVSRSPSAFVTWIQWGICHLHRRMLLQATMASNLEIHVSEASHRQLDMKIQVIHSKIEHIKSGLLDQFQGTFYTTISINALKALLNKRLQTM